MKLGRVSGASAIDGAGGNGDGKAEAGKDRDAQLRRIFWQVWTW